MKLIDELEQLDYPAREIIQDAGFGHLLNALQAMREPTGHCVVRALSERFWDTTNTFHFPQCEMTITPLDVAMITGLSFGGDPLHYSDDLGQDKAQQLALFGPIMTTVTDT